jgi:hypothetical protein
MALIIPPGFAQCAWKFELNGDPEPIVTTCGIDVSGVGGDFDLAAGHARAAFTVGFPAAQMSNQWRYRGVTLRVGQDGAPPIIFESDADIVGLGGATVLPQNCALLVRKRTASAGRRNRGRFYMPLLGVLEAAVSQIGVINAADVTNAQARVDLWFDAMNAGGAEATPPVILHSDGGVTAPGDPTPITSWHVEPIIATQRRRLRR